MSMHCPNCHADLIGDKCPSCGLSWKTKPDWICPDCGAEYYTEGAGKFQSCPACKAVKDKLEQEYWDNKRSELRSVSDDIVAKVLNGGS